MIKYSFSIVGALLLLLFSLSGCAVMGPHSKGVQVSTQDREICERLGIDEKTFAEMKKKPLYKFTEREIDLYLGYLQEALPDLRTRIQHLARKNLGQTYQIFLLGEYPFELYDPDPLYSLDKSDCVVFSEHMYAMALAYDWSSFFALLQRIRYKDGVIGMLTRNHYTEADWDVNNSWLIEDITEEFAGEDAVRQTSVIDRARFFSKHGIGGNIEKQTLEWSYVPYELVPDNMNRLLPGDFINVVRGNDGGQYVGHVGLITRDETGTVNILHSTPPEVVDQSLLDYCRAAERRNETRRLENEKIVEENKKIRAHNERVRTRGKGKIKSLKSFKPYFYGFNFFRLREDPLKELRKIDGPDAPRVTVTTNIK